MANIQKNAAIQAARSNPKQRKGARVRTRIRPGAEKASVGLDVEGR